MMHLLGLTLSTTECIWVGAALGWLTCGASVLVLPRLWRTRDVHALSREEIIALLAECADELRARPKPTEYPESWDDDIG
jgi:hypothetical protein